MRLQAFVNRLENSQISLKRFLITFFSIIFFRNFLETFSDPDNFWSPVPSLAFFIHYPVFYLCLFLGLSILLYAVTKQRIESVSRILFFFFPLVLLAPVLDLLFSGGQGFNMSYLFEDLAFLLRNLITLSWGYSGQGPTPGIQVELIIAFILLGFYSYLKVRKVASAAFAVLASYLLVFVLGSLPSVVTSLWNLGGGSLSPTEMFSGEVILNHFYSFNHKMSLTFFPLLLVELGIWVWLYDKRKFHAMFKNLRGLRALHYVFMLGIGMVIGYTKHGYVDLFGSPFPIMIIGTSAISALLAWWLAVGINDIHDIGGDRLSNPSRPLVSGVIGREEQGDQNLILFFLIIALTAVIRYPFFITVFLSLCLSFVYSALPLRVKRVPILSTFILSLASVLACMGGYMLFSADYSFHGFPLTILLTMVVALTLALTFKDIKDIEGDRISGVITIPTLLGEKAAKRVTGIMILFAYLSVPLILSLLILLPFAIGLGISTFLLINQSKMRETPVILLYFMFLVLTLIFYIPEFQGQIVSGGGE